MSRLTCTVLVDVVGDVVNPFFFSYVNFDVVNADFFSYVNLDVVNAEFVSLT